MLAKFIYLSYSFANFNENFVSEFVSQVFQNRSVYSSLAQCTSHFVCWWNLFSVPGFNHSCC